MDGDLSDAFADQHIQIVGTLNESAHAVSLTTGQREQLANALRREHQNVDDATRELDSLEQATRPDHGSAP